MPHNIDARSFVLWRTVNNGWTFEELVISNSDISTFVFCRSRFTLVFKCKRFHTTQLYFLSKFFFPVSSNIFSIFSVGLGTLNLRKLDWQNLLANLRLYVCFFFCVSLPETKRFYSNKTTVTFLILNEQRYNKFLIWYPCYEFSYLKNYSNKYDNCSYLVV